MCGWRAMEHRRWSRRAPASRTRPMPAEIFEFTAVDEGSWGNDLVVRMELTDATDPALGYLVQIGYGEGDDFGALEAFDQVSLVPDDPRYLVEVINDGSSLVDVEDGKISGRPQLHPSRQLDERQARRARRAGVRHPRGQDPDARVRRREHASLNRFPGCKRRRQEDELGVGRRIHSVRGSENRWPGTAPGDRLHGGVDRQSGWS